MEKSVNFELNAILQGYQIFSLWIPLLFCFLCTGVHFSFKSNFLRLKLIRAFKSSFLLLTKILKKVYNQDSYQILNSYQILTKVETLASCYFQDIAVQS